MFVSMKCALTVKNGYHLFFPHNRRITCDTYRVCLAESIQHKNDRNLFSFIISLCD